MTSGFSFHQGNPGLEASVKPGRAHFAQFFRAVDLIVERVLATTTLTTQQT
jgi:hypothetical protein